MAENKKIRRALISVFHKDNLDSLIHRLHELGVELFSTGGTQSFIESLGVPVAPVESITSFPSILGGRVKTLHPAVFGGILSRRDNPEDARQLEKYQIPEFDLVIVDLYPFEKTIATGATHQEIIEKIDIGGISLIRAAAKNYQDVVIVPSQEEYLPLLNILNEENGVTNLSQRKWFAMKAFAVSSHYDSAIFGWFNADDSNKDSLRISLNGGQPLRYGENPHQNASFYRYSNTQSDITLAGATVLQGKALSFNNLLDADAAWKSASDAWHSVSHIKGKQAVSVVKHLNPCGLAVARTAMEALELAWAGDPVSAFGGIVCFTDTVDSEIAAWFDKRFVEILIAPGFSTEAIEILSQKKNLRLLVAPPRTRVAGETVIRSVSGGLLVQQEDEGGEETFETVTNMPFAEQKLQLARFGVAACKHLKSNAIALVSETKDGCFWLTGAGMGQPNRLDSLRQLTIPRFNQKDGLTISESVLVSDAFFPFRDSIEVANEFGIKYIVEPGGSIRDKEVIDACNEFGMAMLFTGTRHFRH